MRTSCVVAIAALGAVFPGTGHAQHEILNRANIPNLTKSLESKNRTVRYNAIRTLGNHGTAAEAAVAGLIRITCEDTDKAVADQAAVALAQIGSPAVAALDKTLADKRPAVRLRAVTALSVIGPDARDTALTLTTILTDSTDEKLRTVAAHALGEIRSEEKQATHALLRALRDRSPRVRAQAVKSLACLGTEVVPGLKDALVEEHAFVRLDAMQVLAQLGPQAKDALPELMEAANGKDMNMRIAAVNALSAIGGDAKEALPILLDALKEKHLELQQRALQAILRIGSAADDGNALLDALQEINRKYRWATPYVLRQFGPAAKDAVKPLIRRLAEKDQWMRQGSAIALGQIGPEAKEALLALKQLSVRDASSEVRASASMALVSIDSRDKDGLYKQGLEALGVVADTVRGAQQAAWKGAQDFQFAKPDAAQFLRGFGKEYPGTWNVPAHRTLFFHPAIQANYDQAVRGFISIMSALPPRTACPIVRRVQSNAGQLLGTLQSPDAIPALVRGYNLLGIYNIGFV